MCQTPTRPRSELLITSPPPAPLHVMDQPLPTNTLYWHRISNMLLQHILPILEPDFLTGDTISALSWPQMQEILYFACNVMPKQLLGSSPKTGRELQEIVLSRYYAQGARLRTCFNLGSRHIHGADPRVLLRNNEIDWTHGIGHFQLFRGPDPLYSSGHVVDAGHGCFQRFRARPAGSSWPFHRMLIHTTLTSFVQFVGSPVISCEHWNADYSFS